MAVRMTATQTCDRCLKPFHEKSLKAGDTVPVVQRRGLVITEATGTNQDVEPKFKVLLSFDDLCPSCDKAVAGLLSRIRLEPAKKRTTRRSSRKAAKTDSKPTVEEYSETPPKTKEPKSEEAAEPKSKPAKKRSKSAPKTKEPKSEEAAEPKLEPEAEPKAEPEPEAEPAPEPGPEAQPKPAPKAEEQKVVESEKELPDTPSTGDEKGSRSGLIRDPETGDLYDARTGEVVKRGSADPEWAAEGHPF